MTVHLDHAIVPSHSKAASAKLLAELLGVAWTEAGVGPFAAVYINDGLKLDRIDTDEDFPVFHFCFRVSQQEFDAILGRIKAAGMKYRSTVRGPVDMSIDTQFGGSGIYWNEPDGHQWEMLTVSYARPRRQAVGVCGCRLNRRSSRQSNRQPRQASDSCSARTLSAFSTMKEVEQ